MLRFGGMFWVPFFFFDAHHCLFLRWVPGRLCRGWWTCIETCLRRLGIGVVKATLVLVADHDGTRLQSNFDSFV